MTPAAPSWLGLAALALGWGVASGAAVGGAALAAEGYLPMGLELLAGRTLLDAVLVYLGVAGLGAGTWLAVLALARALGRPLPARWASLASLLLVSLPFWGALALHDRWLLPGVFSHAIAVLVLGSLAHVGLLLAAHRWLRAGTGLCVGVVASSFALVVSLVVFTTAVSASRADPSRANLLVVVMDTVRADRLGSYGYPKPTSPEIDAFSRQAIRWSDFYSTSSWTLPSHASLFTGLFPIDHGATQTHLQLGRHYTTLAELLQEQGFETWAASGNPWVDPRTWLTQGFQRFVRTWGKEPPPGAPHPAVAGFRDFLEETDRERPFFAFVNFIEAHAPHTPPPKYRRPFLPAGVSAAELQRIVAKPRTDHFVGVPYTDRELAVLSDLYDAEIAWVSDLFGQLIDALREDGRLDDSWIVLTSDHGEHFGENDRIEHMFTLYNTAVRVPLFVRPPGGTQSPRTVSGPAQLVDVFATLLAALEVEPPGDAAGGRDLLAPDFRRDAVFSEYRFPQQALGLFSSSELEANRDRIDPHRRSLRALQRAGTRLIWSSDGSHELYDLTRDPGETENLYDPADTRAVELLRELDAYAGAATPDPTAAEVAPVIDEDAREALRELGYIR